MQAPFPENEPARTQWLRESGIVASISEDIFDEAVKLAAVICDVPIAAVSLVDEDRQWFKSIVGLDVRETSRDIAFCAHTILEPDVMVVPDARQDVRFADNPLVTGDPNIRFYAGAPLVTSEGYALGSLCVVDTTPKTLSPHQEAVLQVLARQIVGRIELQRRIAIQENLMAERARIAEALRQSEEEMRAIVEQAVDGIFLFDSRTLRVIKTNAALRDMLGYSAEEATRLTLYDISAHDRQSIDGYLKTLVQEREIALGERLYRRRDGSLLTVEVGARVIRHGEGEAFCVVVHNASARKQAEAARLRAEESYLSLFENAAEGIFQTTSAGRFLKANPALARMFGYDTPEEMAESVTDIDSRLYVERGLRGIFQSQISAHGKISRFESQMRRKDGSVFWISESARAVLDGDGALRWYEGFVEDISSRKALEEQRERELREAQERADRDPLTDLLNHRAFHKRLAEESDRARRQGTTIGVVMMDLDNFKFFNEVYGHVLGDQVLRQVADRLRAVSRSYDTPARFGGDEFALLLTDVGDATSASVEARLREDMSGLSYRPEGRSTSIPVTVSVGAALASGRDPERTEIVRTADERLRRAKTGGDIETEADQIRATMLKTSDGFSMLDALVTAVDNKDRYTRRHSEDVARYSLMIACELGLNAAAQETIVVAALLHDVGKIGVPDYILRKPGHLSPDEHETVKRHPQMGALMVSAVTGLEATLDAVRHHHERWDGAGYPGGLREQETPVFARLMAVADAYSAMTTDRPYRQSMDRTQAVALLRSGMGTQWDPTMVQAFVRALKSDSGRTVSAAAPSRAQTESPQIAA